LDAGFFGRMKLVLFKHSSRQHEGAGREAFTLVEIMLVVGIIALVMGTAIPAIRSSLQKQGMVKAIDDIEGACVQARAAAIMSGKPAELHFTPADRTVAAPGKSAQLPDDVNVEMFDVNFTEYKDADSATVRFFPNGRSDDMTVILSSKKGWRMISLDITTAIAYDEDFHR